MSLLLDALKKAALEKQQKNAAGGSSCADENQAISVGADAHDSNSNETAANEDMPSVDNIQAIEDREDKDDGSLELELEDSFTTDEDYGGLSLEQDNAESLQIVEPNPDEMDFDEFGYEVDENDSATNQENDGFGEAFEYKGKELEGNDLADDILNQYAQFAKPPKSEKNDEGHAKPEVIEGESNAGEQGTDNNGPAQISKKSITQNDIDAMIAGAYAASSEGDAQVAVEHTEAKEPVKGVGEANQVAKELPEEALNQLINQSGKEHKRSQLRRIILGVIMLFVAGGLGGFYYYVEIVSNQMMPIPANFNNNMSDAEEGMDDSEFQDQLIDVTGIETGASAESMSLDENANRENITTGAFVNKPVNKPTQDKQVSTATQAKDKPVNKSQKPKPVVKEPVVKEPVVKKPVKSTAQSKSSETQISKTIDKRTTLERTLEEAYIAYHQDQVLQAKVLYQHALKLDKQNRDAMLGLGAVATQMGDYETALSNYSALITINPADDLAQAGLLQVSFQHDSTQIETRLKILMEQSPNSAFLHFALGNVYAKRSHWKPASLQFKRAAAIDPNNADFAYNLSVSLDQLAQREEALFYYQLALSLSWGKNINFSREDVQRRITQLSQSGSSRVPARPGVR